MAITYVGAGAGANGTTSAAPAIPASLADGDELLLVAGGKPYSSAHAIADTEWLPVASATSGTVANAANTGSTVTTVFQRQAMSTMTGTTTVTLTSGSPTIAQTVAFRSETGRLSAVGVGLSDTTETGTAVAATAASDPGITVGDMIVVSVTLKDELITHSSQVVDVPGCTLGTFTWLTIYTTATGNDAGHYIGYATVSSGTSSGAATYTATSNTSGAAAVSGVVVRLREQVLDTQDQVYRLDAQALVSDVSGTNDQVYRLDAQVLVSDTTGQEHVASLGAEVLVSDVTGTQGQVATLGAEVLSNPLYLPDTSIQFVSSTWVYHENISDSVTVTNVRPGDLLIALLGGTAQATSSYYALSSLPPGFTLAGGTLAAPNIFYGDTVTGTSGGTVATKIADGSESTLTFTWTQDVTSAYSRFIVLLVYRNAAVSEIVDTPSVVNTPSAAGSVLAASGAVGLSIGINQTAVTSGACDTATPDTGSTVFFRRRPYNSSVLPVLAVSQFPVAAGNVLPATDWTWTGSNSGLVPSRFATTILLQPWTAPPAPAVLAAQAVQVVEAGASSSRVAAQVVQAVTQPYVPSYSRLATQAVQVVASPSTAPPGATVKLWDGSAWVDAPVKVWDGASWQDATAVKAWNGSAWV